MAIVPEEEFEEYRNEVVINGFKYRFTVHKYISVFWVELGSGKKRKELDVRCDKDRKSLGGLAEVKKWALSCLKEVEETWDFGTIIVQWSDVRRKKIYGRFLYPLGFQLTRYHGDMCYMKKFDNR